MVAGEWGDPWASVNDDAYAALLTHVRSGPGDAVVVDVDHLAATQGVPRARLRAAAARLQDLGLFTIRNDGSWEYDGLSDQDIADGYDLWVALMGPAMRATLPVLSDDLVQRLDAAVASTRSLAALRQPEYRAAFATTAQFWFEHCPNGLVRSLGVQAFERLRWARFPNQPWTVPQLDAWLAAVERVAEDRGPDAVDTAVDELSALFEVQRRNAGIPRPSGLAVSTSRHRRSTTERSLLRDIRTGALPVGSTHAFPSLVARTGSPPAEVTDALRSLADLALVEDDHGLVRIAEPSLTAWRDAMELLGGLFTAAARRLLPALDGDALEDFHEVVERARTDGEVRDHRYTDSAFAVSRFFAEHSGNRWERGALRLAIGRLVYALPEAPAFRQWDAGALWSALDAAAGSGEPVAARTAAELFVDVARAHVDDVTARWGTMGS
ncbi:hypothetical protein NYQ31_03325 [Curtobacterium flaccumfaciens]|uniref:hypothetical protein n=1 Tax=Curtobacterium flaccumfaciens TaxID=2035 RepID=UPI00217DEF12|nr:hypothetical protein [Curtobacterium flaccumfaciens]MCS6557421.1 hypothetical protein [Curtobacterium flaccumfaciens]